MSHPEVFTATRSIIYSAVACFLAVGFGHTAEAVDLAIVEVGPVGGTPSVSIPSGLSTDPNAALGTEGFFIDSGAVTGEFPIRIGTSATDDESGGVLFGYVYENGRVDGSETIWSTSSVVADDHSSSANTRNTSGGLALSSRRAGVDTPGTAYPNSAPFNANFAAAYFPFTQGWSAGTFTSSGGSTFDSFTGAAGMGLSNIQEDAFSQGLAHRLSIPGVVDTRRQGLLFVTERTNDSLYAMSTPAADGLDFTIETRDNTTNGADDVFSDFSFLFMPLGTPNVTMARIHGTGGTGGGANPGDNDPVAMISSGSSFTITHESLGEYRLSITGGSPSQGVLLVQGNGANDGSGDPGGDNILTYEPDGSDWIIQSQDLPSLNPQDNADRGSYFEFAYIPFDAPPTGPSSVPAIETLTTFSSDRIIGWNTTVTEISPGNGYDELALNVPSATSNVTVNGWSRNRADNGFAVDGAFLASADGVPFVTLTEGLRDNSSTGGITEYAVPGVSIDDQEWVFHTNVADPTGGEQNINFAVAVFGPDSGFVLGKNVSTPDGTDPNEPPEGHLDIVIPGENSLTDGVLFGISVGNDDNFVTVEPKGDGSGWDLDVFDNDTQREGNPVNYVYLPYDAQNLVAGRVADNGSLIDSTDPNGFTLSKSGTGEYLLTIDGKTPDDGMLLLNATGPNGSGDNSIVYEPSGSSFKILGLDMITAADVLGGGFVDLEDTSFSFAYIDFDAPPTLTTPGDFNSDGRVDGLDFLEWQRNPSVGSLSDWEANYGTQVVATTQTVPEPTGAGLVLLGVMAALCPRRRLDV